MKRLFRQASPMNLPDENLATDGSSKHDEQRDVFINFLLFSISARLLSFMLIRSTAICLIVFCLVSSFCLSNSIVVSLDWWGVARYLRAMDVCELVININFWHPD